MHLYQKKRGLLGGKKGLSILVSLSLSLSLSKEFFFFVVVHFFLDRESIRDDTILTIDQKSITGQWYHLWSTLTPVKGNEWTGESSIREIPVIDISDQRYHHLWSTHHSDTIFSPPSSHVLLTQ